MSIKLFFIIAFILILISLGSALFHLVTHTEQDQSKKTAKALTFRIGLSLVLFIMIYIAYVTGMIKPHGIGARIQMLKQNQSATANPPQR
ncbi:MAG: twin transmembrane helix small protein [Methylococcaceae bacterium]|nr:twin transmembrane helix small protein [Methylococcaceae bacterium]